MILRFPHLLSRSVHTILNGRKGNSVSIPKEIIWSQMLILGLTVNNLNVLTVCLGFSAISEISCFAFGKRITPIVSSDIGTWCLLK